MPTLTRLLFRPAWPVVLLVLLSLAAAPAQGQVDRWGVKAGVTAMTAGGDGLADEGIGRNTGFVVGGTARISVAGRLSLRPELLLVRKGWTASFRSFRGTNITTTVTLDYLELPVLADVEIVSIWGVTTHVHAGPTVGIKIHRGMETEGEGQEGPPDDNISRTEIGLAGGMGARGKIGAQTVRLSVRYRRSLTNVNEQQVDTPAGRSSSPPPIRLRGLSVAIGLVF